MEITIVPTYLIGLFRGINELCTAQRKISGSNKNSQSVIIPITTYSTILTFA